MLAKIFCIDVSSVNFIIAVRLALLTNNFSRKVSVANLKIGVLVIIANQKVRKTVSNANRKNSPSG